MPGSKGYTLNKVNELFEIEMYESAKIAENKRGKSVATTIFKEVVTITLSILGTTYYNYRFMLPQKEIIETIPYTEQIHLLLYHILGFIIIYVLLTGLTKLIKWLFEIIFGKRLLPSVKKKSYDQFHKKILNYIYLGVSFENKFSLYLSNYLRNENSRYYTANIDLAVTYFSQSVYYFDKAYLEIENIFPYRTKRNGRKENGNAKFLKHIGYSHLLISFSSACNSLSRLNKSINLLETKITSASDIEKNYYKLSLNELNENHIKRLISVYEELLVRTKSLKKHSDSQVN